MRQILTNNLLRYIDTIARQLHSVYEAEFKNYNLQRGQFIFLTKICELPGISLKELSYQLKMDKTTVTKAIQKLIIAGYIDKIGDEQDRRIVHLNPTEKALELSNNIISEKNRIIGICLKGINANDYELLESFIKIILKNINTEWENIIGYK